MKKTTGGSMLNLKGLKEYEMAMEEVTLMDVHLEMTLTENEEEGKTGKSYCIYNG